MEQSNQGIHGQMVQSSSHSVQSSQERISLTRWRLLPKKEPFGGMPIVNGLEPQSMVPSSSYQLREPFIHFLSLMKKKSSPLVCLIIFLYI